MLERESKISIDWVMGGGATCFDVYDFYQEMRSYVKDLLECLNEKVSYQ